jgi:Tol biopolymer transport system component
LRGERVSTASDVYALGVLLYTLLSGQHPYRFPTLQPHDVARAILEQEPDCPSAAVLRAPSGERTARRLRGDLDAIVLKAMEKDPRRRFTSVEQLEADVRRYLAGVPITARPTSHFERARKFVGRHRVQVGTAGVLALLTLGFTTAIKVQAERLALQRDRADASSAELVRTYRLLSLASPIDTGASATRPAVDRSAVRVDHTGGKSLPVAAEPLTKPVVAFDSRIVFVSDRLGPDAVSDFGHQEIYVMNPDGSGQRQLTHGDGLIAGPVISPDGRFVAFSSRQGEDSQLFIVDVDGGEPIPITTKSLMPLGAIAPSWSPDSKRLAFSSLLRPDIWTINVNGTSLRKLTTGGNCLRPAWSPGGDKIAFVGVRDGASGIHVMDADGTNQTHLPAMTATGAKGPWILRPAWSPDGRRIAFSSARDGNIDVYVVNVDGSGLTRLTSDPADDVLPVWSPDGRHVAFMSNRRLDHMQVFVMNADGSDQQSLTLPSRTAFSGFPSWGVIPRASLSTTQPKR